MVLRHNPLALSFRPPPATCTTDGDRDRVLPHTGEDHFIMAARALLLLNFQTILSVSPRAVCLLTKNCWPDSGAIFSQSVRRSPEREHVPVPRLFAPESIVIASSAIFFLFRLYCGKQ